MSATISTTTGATTISTSGATNTVLKTNDSGVTVSHTEKSLVIGSTVDEITINQNQVKGVKGEKGDTGEAGNRYEHIQAVPSSAWTVSHNFGSRPFAVEVVDTAGDDVWGDVIHTDLNTTTINFSAPFAGVAYVGG